MSFQSLARSTALIGSSSVATTLVAILRVKALAVMVGPAGVGLLGVLASLSAIGTTTAALGSEAAVTRGIALDRADTAKIARVRRALLLVGAVHGLASVAAFWLMREAIALWLLGSLTYAREVGMLGIAVALSLVAGLQIAQLQGLGRVEHIARINVLASAAGTTLGLAAVWLWGLPGLVFLVIAQPALAALFASSSARWTVPDQAPRERPRLREIGQDWRGIVVQGLPYMLSFVLLALMPLLIRALVVHELGMDAAGHFHAAWTMSVIYVGFLLNAMSADYYPRLTAIVGDREAACALVNDQIQLALALGGIAVLIMLATAPILVPLLYSKEFSPAADLVAWQAVGNLMKLAGWPIAFIAMARGRSLQYFLIELTWSLLMLALVWFGLPRFGILATALASAASCGVFLILQLTVAYTTYGFRLSRNSQLLLGAYTLAGISTLLASRHSIELQALTGGSLAIILGLASLRFVVSKLSDGSRLATMARRSFARLGWPMADTLATGRGSAMQPSQGACGWR